MLSRSERAVVIERLKTYPAGIPTAAWGYGPFIEDVLGLKNSETKQPGELPLDVQREYG